MTAAAAGDKLPLGFVIATFVVGAAVAVLIIYFGVRGQLGASIP